MSAEAKNEQLREQLLQAVLKKRACATKAQKIVESLLEPINDKDAFLTKLKYLSPDHYTDVVEERFVSKICGYPLCAQMLENIPKHKYHICTTQNKVYDLKERKQFCSGFCFKASEYIKTQIPTSPLWLRDQEEQPEFKLLDETDIRPVF